MDARELRIGNLIQLYRKPVDKGMSFHAIKSIVYSDDDCGYMLEMEDGFLVNADTGVEPIPLTDEWIKDSKEQLKKTGFEIVRTKGLSEKYPAEYILQGSYSEGDGGYYPIGNVDYVHRLQNLYYALELEELEFKTLG